MNDQEPAIRATYTAEATTWAFSGLATLFFALKTFSRFGLKNKTNILDDIFISASWTSGIIRQGLLQRGFILLRAVQPGNLETTVPKAILFQLLTNYYAFVSVAIPKFAIGLILIRLFKPRCWLKTAILTLCIVCLLLSIGVMLLGMLQCTPLAHQWDPYGHPDGHCISETSLTIFTLFYFMLGSLIDVFFAVYPGIVIWGLKLPMWKRIGTATLMSMGLVASVVSIVKMVILWRLQDDMPFWEDIYNCTLTAMYCAIENDILTCGACMPFMPAIFRSLTHRVDASPPPTSDYSRGSREIKKSATETTSEMSLDKDEN